MNIVETDTILISLKLKLCCSSGRRVFAIEAFVWCAPSVKDVQVMSLSEGGGECGLPISAASQLSHHTALISPQPLSGRDGPDYDKRCDKHLLFCQQSSLKVGVWFFCGIYGKAYAIKILRHIQRMSHTVHHVKGSLRCNGELIRMMRGV